MPSEHFKLSEFACKCCGQVDVDLDFLHKLNFARGMAEIPFVVHSGYRCDKHNKAEGGAPDSAHTKGLAADIRCRNSRERYLIIKAALAAGIHRIGIGQLFIHLDDDSTKPPEVIWLYSG